MSLPKILVVDDEPDILAAVARFLEGALGLQVTTANGGVEGLQALSAPGGDQYLLVLSDFRMPGMDGLQFLAKAQQVRPDVPRVMMTAYPDMQLAIKALNETRVERFLVKPVDPGQLEAVVREVSGQATRRRAREAAMQRATDVTRPRGPSSTP